MSAPSVAELVDELERAIDRRADAGWAGHERATAAIRVARQDLTDGADRTGLEQRLADLGRHFDLDDGDLRLLLTAAVAELDPTIGLAVGLLSGGQAPAGPSAALALELIGETLLTDDPAPTRNVGALRIAAAAPLLRWGLLSARGDGTLPSRELRVGERVIAALLGDRRPAPELRPLLTEPVPVSTPESRLIAGALRAGCELIWVDSPPGTAGAAVAAAACRECDVPALQADLARADAIGNDPDGRRDPDRVRALVRALLVEAALAGAVLILTGAEHAGPAADLLTDPPLPVIAVAARRTEPVGGHLPVTVTAPRLGPEQRADLWGPLLDGTAPPPEVAALRIAPDDIVRVARHARTMADMTGEEQITVERIRDSGRQLGSGRHPRPAGAPGLDDLVLPDHARQEIARLLDWVRYRDSVAAGGLLSGAGGHTRGISALFTGSPGTGKTLAANVIADSLAMDLYAVELSSVIDKYIGETEKNLERIFTAAEAANSVLFFDEADALFGSRSEIKDSKDRYANQEIAYLLQRMEHFDGVTVLATNLRGNLDPAFSRRLQFIVHFPDPDVATRRLLWERHLAELADPDPDDPIDVSVLAEALDVAGGDIRNIVLAAAFQAIAAGQPVGMRHLRSCAARELTKLGRRIPSPLDSTR